MSLFLVENNAPEPKDAVNESGGAHQKLMELRKDKKDKALSRMLAAHNLRMNAEYSMNNDKDKNEARKIADNIEKGAKDASEYKNKEGKKAYVPYHVKGRIAMHTKENDIADFNSRLKKTMGIGKDNAKRNEREPGFYKRLQDIKRNEAFDLAVDYLQGCLEGTYEIDEELLEACVEVINENTNTLTVDDYNAVMESVEYLTEANAEKISKKLDKLNAKHNANLEKLKVKYNRSYGKFADSANNDAPENKQKRLLKKADNIERKTDKAIDKYNAKKAKLEEQLKNAKKSGDKPTGRHIDLEKEKKEIKDLIQSYRNADESWRETAKKDKEYSKRIKELEEKLSKG